MRNPTATKQDILAAAEHLFAAYGYDGTSLREVTKTAKVNLAAVNYHFVDKESLYIAVIARRIQPINEVRLNELGVAERQAGSEPVPLDLIFDILVRPVLELNRDASSGGHHVARLLGRSLAEPLPFMDELLAKEFHQITARFGQAIRRHIPRFPPEDFLWRLSFIVGALHHTLATLHCMKELTRGICRNDDHEGARRRFVQFAVTTITAPLA